MESKQVWDLEDTIFSLVQIMLKKNHYDGNIEIELEKYDGSIVNPSDYRVNIVIKNLNQI